MESIGRNSIKPFGFNLQAALLDENSQIIDLDELGPDDVSEVLNAHNPIVVQSQSIGLRIVRCTINDLPTFYLFLPDGGTYGDNALQTTMADFVPLAQYVSNGDWTRIGIDIYNNNPGPVNILNILRVIGLIEIGHNPAYKITDGGGTVHIRFPADGRAELFGIMNDLFDLSEFYDDLSHVNAGWVKARTGYREFSFTAAQAGPNPPQATLINNPTGAVLTPAYIDIGISDFVSDQQLFGNCISAEQTVTLFDGDCVLTGYVRYEAIGADIIRVRTFDAAGLPADNIMNGTFLMTLKLLGQ